MRNTRVMTRMMWWGMIVCVFAINANLQAEMIYDSFYLELDEYGRFVEGGGTGYPVNGAGRGEWYSYPPQYWSLWNQWFYDHPYDPDLWKKIDLFIAIAGTGPDAWAEISVNWSSDLYPNGTGQPPLPPLDPTVENDWIIRELIFYEKDILIVNVEKSVTIPHYNPEWVSIGIRGRNINTFGWFGHECIPEPYTISLLALGGLALLRKRRLVLTRKR